MKTLEKYWHVLIVCVLLVGGAGDNGKKNVCFKDTCFRAEVARTNPEQTKGLMFRKSLTADSGMLFVYEVEELRPFCMKNTHIALDMVWIDRDKKVVFIKEDAQPAKGSKYETIYPDKAAMYVLEVNAGTVEKLGIKEGDELKF